MPDKPRRKLRCAIYTRKSSDEGLEQDFNSLDAQREACEAYIVSQKHEGWTCLPDLYDDGGISGATMERPALQRLLADIKARKVDVVVVYKVDRLTRALADFAKIVEIFDAQSVSFVSVTQQFNTTSSMGRLTLNVLLSFAQFEREVIRAIVRAHAWVNEIASGKIEGIKTIALREKLNERYVRRILDLAFLAPDIARSILDGTQPENLMLQDLMIDGVIPLDWAEQKRLFHFS